MVASTKCLLFKLTILGVNTCYADNHVSCALRAALALRADAIAVCIDDS